MKRRVRITERLARRNRDAVDGPPYDAYPGTVNQTDREFRDREEYDNWEEVVNHPYPDMRDEWKEDSRDDIGFGDPEENPPVGNERLVDEKSGVKQVTKASIRVAASKAVKLAVLLLGDKVSEKIIEAQARDFMRLGNEGLDSSLSRFSKTADIYAEEEKEEEEEIEEEEEKKAAEEEEKVEEEEDSEEEKEASENLIDDEDNKPSEDNVKTSELDIELTQASDGEVEEDAEADKLLASIYSAEDEDADDSEAEEDADEESCKASAKRGAKSLGGQPKVASGNNGPLKSLTDLWESAPDITEVFE